MRLTAVALMRHAGRMSSVIHDFECECQRAGFTPAAVLRRAGLNPSNWPRWRSGDSSPTLRSFEAAREALMKMKDNEPGSSVGEHGSDPSVDDAAVLAPMQAHGAEKTNENFSRTGVVG